MDIRERTEKKVFSYINEHCMLAPHDRIAVGVSGGADSLCLLALLLRFAEKLPLSLAVVHVNHGIRSDAGEDARYVEELCRRWNLPFFLTEADVRGVAERERCSEEDAGRRIRYRALRQAVERMGGGRIAVAHNSNDNAETMLFHLLRGSGIKGLGGIPPVRKEEDGTVIVRPILCLERQEVEDYLREREIPWRRDSTNDEDAYSRNRIRHHILPYAEREVEGAVRHMGSTAEQLREVEDYLEGQTREALERCLVGETGSGDGEQYVLEAAAFQGLHQALRKRVLLVLMKELSPTGKDIGAVHVRDVLTLFEREGNRSVSLPFGIRAWRQYGEVVMTRREEAPRPDESSTFSWQERPMILSLGEELFRHPLVCDLGNGTKIEFSASFFKKEEELPKNRYTKWFDYDRIEECAAVRSRDIGDFLTIADGKGNMVHKSLKDYMIAEKIPRQLRDSIPVVALGRHVLWVVGWRISEYFKVSGNTERILQVKLIRNSETEEKDVRAH